MIPLSPREEEVARLIGRGWSYERIAISLGVRRSTIGVHVVHIASKIANPHDLKPQALVTLWAARNRWLKEHEGAA